MNAAAQGIPLPAPSGSFRFLLPTEIRWGAVASLGDVYRTMGTRPLVVTGRASARACGALDQVLGALADAVLFEGVEENPSTDTCDRVAALCREHACDFVVALGGGSAMDVGKAVAGLARNPGACGDYFGSDAFTNGALPIVAVPTTAGTGSEVTPGAVIVDRAAGVKRTISGRAVYPSLAVLDPETTLSMPRAITVNTGLDALSQAMEGVVSKKATPITDALAFEACRLVKQHLPTAADDGTNRESRAAMLYASLLSGCVIAQTGTTLVHGMGYYLTLECGLAHGLANALLLTPLFQHNARCLPEKVAAIAGALGVAGNASPDGASKAIAEALHGLLARLGVSRAACDAGVDETRLAGFARHIINDPYRFKNQVGDLPVDAVERLFRQAYEGGVA